MKKRTELIIRVCFTVALLAIMIIIALLIIKK